MPEMLAIALKGLPRASYRVMTKYSTPASGDPAAKIDQFRQQLNTEYIDILLLHCLRPPTWATDYESLQDGFSLAQQKGIIRAHGASIHGLPALRTIPGNQWLQEVVAHTRKVHQQGMGVISMKLVGEGRFYKPEDRDAAMKFAMNLGCVDAVTVGFKNAAEIDEAIERIDRVMNA